jgi:hypothetical protein
MLEAAARQGEGAGIAVGASRRDEDALRLGGRRGEREKREHCSKQGE